MQLKHIFNTVTAATFAAVMAFTACTKEESLSDGSRTPVRFAADIERSATPATRAAGTAWEANDNIGIFMVEAGTTTVAGSAENKQYTTATTAGTFTPAAGNEIFYPTNGQVDFIAYYPYKEGTALGTTLPIVIGDQNDQPAFDLLWTETKTGTPAGFSESSTGAVGLTFNHKLSKFVIKPQPGTDVTANELASMTLRIEGMNTTNTFDLATGALGTPGTVAGITPRTVTDGAEYDAIIMPADYAAGAVKVFFTVDGDEFTWTLGEETFAGGNEYSYTVTLSRTPAGNEATVTGSINPWTESEEGDVTVTPDEDIDDVLAEITDANFKAAVTTLMTDEGWDANTDGKLSPAEAAAVTDEMNVSGKGIGSMTGIEYFTALTDLYCNDNDLDALDVSKNTALTALDCSGNAIDALDVSANTALTLLNCYNNDLDALDVTKNTALTRLTCYNNALNALDVSANTALTVLYCHNNDLDALDVSNNTALTALDCSGNALTTLDVSKNTALTSLYCDNNDLTTLDVSANTALNYLYCNGDALDALDVSKNTKLTQLNCSNNALDALDVTKNTKLTLLNCHNNDLGALDVSKNTALTDLDCSGNALTALDVTKNTALTTLYCGDGSTVLTVTVDAAHDISTDGNLEVHASNGNGDTTTRITALNTPMNGVTVTAGGTSGDPQTIDAPEDGITGITAPATGAAPTATVPETDEWTATPAWMVKVGESSYVPFTDDAFAAETEYSVDITLTAKSGWQFAIDPGITDNTEKVAAWFEYMEDFVPAGGTLNGINNLGLNPPTTKTTVTIDVLFPATAADPTGDNITIGGADDENEDWEE